MEVNLSHLFSGFSDKYREKKILFTTHIKADVDGISSMFALSSLFPNSFLSYMDRISDSAKPLSMFLGLNLKKYSDIRDFDYIVVVDTSSKAMVPEIDESKLIAIFDHHQPNSKTLSAKYEFIDPSSPSTAEIVAELVGKGNWTQKVSLALAAGIISDTARFKGGRTKTFSLLSKLLEHSSIPYVEVLKLAEPRKGYEARIEILKGLSKVSYEFISSTLVAYSIVEGEESSVAQILSDIADIALVASWKKGERETRISARGSPFTSVPLNEIMAECGKVLGGEGGGHLKAAGCTSKKKPEESIRLCIDLIKDYIANNPSCECD